MTVLRVSASISAALLALGATGAGTEKFASLPYAVLSGGVPSGLMMNFPPV